MPIQAGFVEKILTSLFGPKGPRRFKKILILLLVVAGCSYLMFVLKWECNTPKGKVGGDPIKVELKKEHKQ